MVEDRPITRNLPSIYYFAFPDAEETARAVNRHTAREGMRPPEIAVRNGEIHVQKHQLFRSSIAYLRTPFWPNPLFDQGTVKKLRSRGVRSLSFVVPSDRSERIDSDRIKGMPHERQVARFLSRPIMQGETIGQAQTDVKFVNINLLSGKGRHTAWRDFIHVYKAARLTGTETRAPDRMAVVLERLRHIQQRSEEDQKSAVFVGYLNKVPVATGSVWPMRIDGVDCVQFADANTHPDFQKLGIGKALVDHRLYVARQMRPELLAFSMVFEDKVHGQNFSVRNLVKNEFQPWFDVVYIDLPRVE